MKNSTKVLDKLQNIGYTIVFHHKIVKERFWCLDVEFYAEHWNISADYKNINSIIKLKNYLIRDFPEYKFYIIKTKNYKYNGGILPNKWEFYDKVNDITGAEPQK